MQTWVDDELATADLGDQRLNQRFRLVLDRLSQKPSLKFPAACRGQAEIQAAYRFLDNDRVTADKVLAPHRTATLARLRAQPVALLIQDTTDLDVTRKQERMAGAGPLNDEAHVGFYDHVLVAVTPAQVMLGVLDAQIWARDPEEFARSAAVKAQARKTKTIEEKESVRWLEGYRHACQVAAEAPDTQIVCVSDSEGDVYECFEAAQPADGQRKADWIVRACQNRALLPAATPEGTGGEGATAAAGAAPAPDLWSQVAQAAVLTTLTIEVSRREPKSKDDRKRKPPRSARTAVVSGRAAVVTLRPPARPGRKLAAVTVHAVLVREDKPPAGEAPIEWLLLTSLPIATVEEVLRVVEGYCCRWQIEIYFRVLKSGCNVEASQLEQARRFEPFLALCMIVAWRVLYTMRLGRECPELPCTVVFEDDEWRAVYAVVTNAPPPTTLPTLGEVVLLVATLGGYQHRKGDGPPGPKALWVGLQRLTDLTLAWQAFAQHGPRPAG